MKLVPPILAAALALAALLASAYFIGVFTTSFDTNLCYSKVLGSLSDKAQAAAAAGDGAQMERYARLMKSLPLEGYETQCERILAEVKSDPVAP